MRLLLALAFGVGLIWAGQALADPCEAIPSDGPLPAYLSFGARFSGPVAFVIDGDSFCVAVGPGHDQWVEVRAADFFAPMNPKESGISFAPPDTISFTAPDGSFTLTPRVYPIIETGEFDQVTFQPLTGPDKTNPTSLGFFVGGYSYKLLWFIPASIHFVGSTNGHTFHLLGPHLGI